MKTAGVIVEYNPFHNGHLFHLTKTKQKTGADLMIAVMSGNFLQRGEPALVSKWTRTKMALQGGADIVIELPYAFATQKATTFAYGAIALLDSLFVDEVCFGSESGEVDEFHLAINHLEENKILYEDTLHKYMQQGVNFPTAASKAFKNISDNQSILDLTQPNNILGFQYIKAIKEMNSNMKAATIKRTGSNYHDQTFTKDIASATSIRNALLSENKTLDSISSVVPLTTFQQLEHYVNVYHVLHSWENYFPLLKYRLLTMKENELKNIYEAEEGLENRLRKYILESTSFEEFMNTIKTKRYTWTRLQRFCVHILTNTTKEEMKENMKTPHYLRLLGMSLEGQNYLKTIKKKLLLPLVSNLSSIKNDQLSMDKRAIYAYASILKEPLRTKMIKEEYSTPPLRYDHQNSNFL